MEKRSVRLCTRISTTVVVINQEIWGQRFLEESVLREHMLRAIGSPLIPRSGLLRLKSD